MTPENIKPHRSLLCKTRTCIKATSGEESSDLEGVQQFVAMYEIFMADWKSEYGDALSEGRLRLREATENVEECKGFSEFSNICSRYIIRFADRPSQFYGFRYILSKL
jgi:hypothetical protein